MGSGKRNYKNRPKKFTLGAFKPEEPKQVDKEDADRLLDLWQKAKKKNENPT